MERTPTYTHESPTAVQTVDAHRAATLKHLVADCYHLMAALHALAPRLPTDCAMRDQAEHAETLVTFALVHGLEPWIVQANRALWQGGELLSNAEPAGLRAVGMLMQVDAMRQTPGLGDALVRLVYERLDQTVQAVLTAA
jgi:hypothetical protein